MVRGAISCSGSTAEQSPAWATAPGMPHTTLLVFILRDHAAAGSDDLAGAAGAVGAHAGKHDGEIARCPRPRPPKRTADRRQAGRN